MNLREAAQQALEALERYQVKRQDFDRFADEIANLRAALAEDSMQRLTNEQQEMEATCQESRQVEPVAYVTGYSKGYATVQPIDPCLLMPVGMALYRSPPANQNYLNGYCVGRTDLLAEQAKAETVEPVAWAVITKGGKLYKAASTKESAERKARQQIDKLGVEWECSVVPLYLSPTAVKMVATINKAETVEPVAWLIESYDIYAKRTLQRLVFDNPKNMQGVKITAYYTAQPKRKPLTEKQIKAIYDAPPKKYTLAMFARAIERAHGIGGEE
jgi:hypothetical protein